MVKQKFFVDVAGTNLDTRDKELLQHPAIAGVVLFARNYQSKNQITELCAAIKTVKSDLLIAVDQEGGRVQRFINQGFAPIPPMQTLAQAPHTAKAHGTAIAEELKLVGIDINFAPVLDLAGGNEIIIGNRAISADPYIVAEISNDFIVGMVKAGIMAVGKHFPGHGSVALDSHKDLPVDERTMAEMREKDLVPYQMLIEADALPAIMTAHIKYPAINSEIATFSGFWLKDILRDQLKFKGKIFSDDLFMLALQNYSFEERVQKALEAGCDYLIACNNREIVWEALNRW